MLKPEFPIKDRKKRREREEKEEIKRKKRKGKEGFPIEDRKKVKRKRSKEKQNNSRSIQETRKENRRSSDQIIFGKVNDCRQRENLFF